MRLTKKSTSDYIHNKLEKIRERMKEKISANPACEEMAYIETHERDELRYEKLGQLEDIEDELGIDLIILLKAVKNGIYVKHPYSIDYESFRIDYWKDYKTNEEGMIICGMEIKDYGKTWALTKEELEND